MFEFLKNFKPQLAQGQQIQPIQAPQVAQPLNNSQRFVANEVFNDYLNSINNNQIPYAQDIVNQHGADKVIRGIQQGLNFGVPDISQWQQQYNGGAGREMPIKIPATPEEMQMAEQGSFNPLSGGVDSRMRNDIFNKFINGLGDFQKGYKENLTTPFSAENLRPDENKSIVNRIGEGFGTATRFANSPAGRGLIVGGLVGATGGNPLQMMSYGGSATVQNQQNVMRDDLYRQQLKNLGYSDEQLAQVNGYIDAESGKNISDSIYKQKMGNAYQQNADVNQYYKTEDIKVKNRNATTAERNADTNQNKAKTDAWYKGGQLKIGQQNANSNSKKADAYAKGKQADAEMSDDLSFYMGLEGNERNQARQYFVKNYGKDPEKLLKSDAMEQMLQMMLEK